MAARRTAVFWTSFQGSKNLKHSSKSSEMILLKEDLLFSSEIWPSISAHNLLVLHFPTLRVRGTINTECRPRQACYYCGWICQLVLSAASSIRKFFQLLSIHQDPKCCGALTGLADSHDVFTAFSWLCRVRSARFVSAEGRTARKWSISGTNEKVCVVK